MGWLGWLSLSLSRRVPCPMASLLNCMTCSGTGQESACTAGDNGSIPGSGRSPGGGNSHPLQYPCLGDPIHRRAWRATVHGVTKSWMQLTTHTHMQLTTHTHTHTTCCRRLARICSSCHRQKELSKVIISGLASQPHMDSVQSLMHIEGSDKVPPDCSHTHLLP